MSLVWSLHLLWQGPSILSTKRLRLPRELLQYLIPVVLLVEMVSMKTALFIFCMFCATGALAQVGALDANAHPIDFPSHPEHASRQPLAAEQNILGDSYAVVTHGERPLWEVSPLKEEPSLGEVARIQRKQHARDKKAPVVWHN
jgi:hypothetical protein